MTTLRRLVRESYPELASKFAGETLQAMVDYLTEGNSPEDLALKYIEALGDEGSQQLIREIIDTREAAEADNNTDMDEEVETYQCPECGYETPGCGCPEFADPGNPNSALRAASKRNPRNRPCPTCRRPNRLTPEDVSLGYQCDDCADRMERGGP